MIFPFKAFIYVTNGQNVPDDITVADEHAIIGLIVWGYQRWSVRAGAHEIWFSRGIEG